MTTDYNKKYTQTEKPVYDDSYDRKLKDSGEKIKNRAEFSYDAASDPLYKKYKADYMAQGSLSMRDAAGQAAQLSGGYSSSYSEKAAQQQYDRYLTKLGDVIPQLYQLAYSRYDRQGEKLRDEYEEVKLLRDTEYERYSDALDRYDAQQAENYRRERDAAEDARKTSDAAAAQAALKAKYGDFSGYAALYGDDTAASMRNYWISATPKIAYGMGLISPESYYHMTGDFAPGYEIQPDVPAPSKTYYPNTAPDGRSAKVVQKQLRDMGYNIAVDGAWGPKSQAAWDKAFGKNNRVQLRYV